ncbi:Nif3-like dinuclear metal center hexameric protein [Enterovibrio sp. ZSDZ42]|uniref:Nif3-like dinuclear metal center hexameric protein n=1 Tax=Enterovibrio gelatinilyticus TaxID=2899819 RepID=A0ABT5QYU9_9GAMM|nr:Nif3-like dinuclear metal center hexameric protein [Enterovibrio sp. ZSDZ42]MDD1792944.1 Nif3-like dinuclear metal center hexameric protein [Enterovibrio sp. ZSDZ42]
MNNLALEAILNEFLKPNLIKDYCPNGLQVEGKPEIKKIVTGVTASQALVDAAIEQGADAVLVHHGYFWRGEPEPIRGMKYRRIKALVENGINLYAYHLPLDVHPDVGNNAQLARLLGIDECGGLEDGNPRSVAVWGELPEPLSASEFASLLEKKLGRRPLFIDGGQKGQIKRVGWCTGGGQDYIDLAASKGMDAFVSGEVSERTTFSAREQGLHYFGAGHHATERYGIKALGEWLSEHHQMDVTFIDIYNPV